MYAFDIGQPFLFLTTLYVIIPSVLIYLALVMPRCTNRIVNSVAAVVYGVTIVGSAIGEWGYYVFGSAVEAFLLAVLVYHAWTWPERDTQRDG